MVSIVLEIKEIVVTDSKLQLTGTYEYRLGRINHVL